MECFQYLSNLARFNLNKLLQPLIIYLDGKQCSIRHICQGQLSLPTINTCIDVINGYFLGPQVYFAESCLVCFFREQKIWKKCLNKLWIIHFHFHFFFSSSKRLLICLSWSRLLCFRRHPETPYEQTKKQFNKFNNNKLGLSTTNQC